MNARLNRREVLGLGAATWALCGSAPAARSAPGQRAVVVVQLFGGNDGLNTLVPLEDDRYHRLRPATRVTDAVPIAPGAGLHPALVGLLRRYREGSLRIVRGVGYPRPSLSHFHSQDVWDAARPDAGVARTGWLGRAVELDPGLAGSGPLAACAVGLESPPLALVGQRYRAPAVRSLRGNRLPPARFAPPAEARSLFEGLLEVEAPGERLARVVRAERTLQATLASLERAAGLAPRVRYPSSRLASDLEVAARLLEAGLARALWVRQASYDTHTRQAGRHARLLAELDGALDAFARDLSAMGRLDSTLVLTVSEFGRRPAESGTRGEAGTDHGTASVALALGGGTRGGLVGPAPDLGALDQDGNPAYAIDFRALFAEVLDWLGTDPAGVLGRSWPAAGLVS